MRRRARGALALLTAGALLGHGCAPDPAQVPPQAATAGPAAERGPAAPRAPQAVERLGDAPLLAVLEPLRRELTPPLDVAPYAVAELAGDIGELVEFARAMAGTVARDPGAADSVGRDVRSEGAAVVRALVTVALDAAAGPDLRAAAVGLLPATAVPAAAFALVEVAARASEPWLRRLALWRVREVAPVAGADGALLALILRRKYETDDEALVWLAGSLAAFGVHAGVEDLVRLAASASPAQSAAADELRALVAAAGATSAEALLAAWRGAPPEDRAAQSVGSSALEAELWRAVDELSGERFQLRGVDDARYALSRLPAQAAAFLAPALRDVDPFVRLHTAQVLERMGPRAALALAALEERLADPHTGVAAAAAEAIGAIGRGANAEARAAAAQRLAPLTQPGIPHELRVAAVRGLARLGAPSYGALLTALAADTAADQDLRLAAAEGAVALGAGDALVPYLLERLADPLGDAGAAESLLALWLERRAQSPRDSTARAALDLWRALAPPFERVHTPDEVRLRRRARAALIDGLSPR